MVSARSRKTLSAEKSLAKTCTDTVSYGPSDVLSVSDDDYDDDDDDDDDDDYDDYDETYSNFEEGRKESKENKVKCTPFV
jgi:hypothetical protein